LDTETEAIDSSVAVASQPGRRDGFGIRLQRHFPIRRDVKGVLARADDAPDLFRFEERRRAPAEIDRVGRGPGPRRPRPHVSDFGDQRLDITRLDLRIEEAAIEIAVVADCRAERDVDVQTEHFRFQASDFRLIADCDFLTAKLQSSRSENLQS
jgi:hypothetical protein